MQENNLKLHVLCVAYNRQIDIITICSNFLRQTNHNWELTIMYDGPVPDHIKQAMSIFTDERINYTHSEKRNGKYGHPNRRYMLEQLKPEKDSFVLITNEDNYYVPIFVEAMLGAANNDTGFVMCDTLHSYMGYGVLHSKIREKFIDMGSFIVRTDVAKEVGFNHDDFSADGKYAEECADYCYKHKLGIMQIQRPLFIHN